ncbi:hypothetical protein HMPREF3137_18555 [Achromobacter xylosoxidans]|nr:hypothetical protein HMPREF3137_18555 [Achromobacter xylosoxidans]
MTMELEVSQARKSGSVNENQRDESAASAASSKVDFPESPGPMRQQKEESGFQSSAEMPRKFEILSCRICMLSLSMYARSICILQFVNSVSGVFMILAM